jgi:hypothetical protein
VNNNSSRKSTFVVRAVRDPIVKSVKWYVMDMRTASTVGEYGSRRLARLAARKFNESEERREHSERHVA